MDKRNGMTRPIWKSGALLSLAAIFLSYPALAQNVGDACTGTNRQYTVSGTSNSALICNGTTLELLEKDLSGPVRKGIGTASPAATLDINGEAKIGNTGLACSAATEGAMRYNGTSDEMEYCNGTAWASLSPAAGSSSPYCPECNDPGYFVLASGSWTGNLGGRSGADANCLSDLTANDWKGKSDASARGVLDSSHVEAFLCDSSSCSMGKPFVRYYFARSGDTDVGGAYFETDAKGDGPLGDASPDRAWGTQATLGAGSINYWSGRNNLSSELYLDNSTIYHCTDWSGTGGSGTIGVNIGTTTQRWSNTATSCNSSYRLVCFVHPTP